MTHKTTDSPALEEHINSSTKTDYAVKYMPGQPPSYEAVVSKMVDDACLAEEMFDYFELEEHAARNRR